MSRNRAGALSLAAAGVLFVLYPAIRPWHDESTVSGATASMSSTAWVAAHFCAMLGFILVPLGLLALWGAFGSARSASLALAATVATWIGAGLALPYYGAEDFGLHAIASKHAGNLLGLIKAIRYQPLAITIFGAGLLTLGVGAVLAAVAIWRSGVLPTPRVTRRGPNCGTGNPARPQLRHGSRGGAVPFAWRCGAVRAAVSPSGALEQRGSLGWGGSGGAEGRRECAPGGGGDDQGGAVGVLGVADGNNAGHIAGVLHAVPGVSAG
jgi:hypothetical protein